MKSRDPFEIWDIIYKKWEFIGAPIDLTNDKQYYLKHIWYNKERKDSKGCVINYVDNEKNRIAIINVNYFAPVVDQLPSPGSPITNAAYQYYDCDIGMYHDGTLSATPYWENVGPIVNSACNESCSLNQTISVNVSIGFQAGIKYVIVAIIGGNWSETESYSATGSCSSKPLKRRQLKCYQKGYYTIRDFEWGFFTYDEQQQKCLTAPVENLHHEETIWKYEIIYNCATYAMDPPSGS